MGQTATRRIRGWVPTAWHLERSDEDRLKVRSQHQSSFTRLSVPAARLGNALAADELLATMLIVRKVVDSSPAVRAAELVSIKDSKGNLLASLMYVIRRNLRNPRFNGRAAVRGFPKLRDEVYMWRQIILNCID